MTLLRKLADRFDGAADPDPGLAAGDILSLRSELDDLGRRASVFAERLDDLGPRFDYVAASSQSVAAFERRLAILESSLEQAEARAAETLQHTAEIEGRRESLQELISRATKLVSKMEALTQDRAAVAQFDQRLPVLKGECQQISEQHTALQREVDLVHTTLAALIEDAGTTRQVSREARENTDKTAAIIADVQHRLEALPAIDRTAQNVDAQLQALNALAEHVSAKLKALENQHQMVDRALVESRRVNEMVWDMEVQIGKVANGSTLAAQAEENLARLERLQQEIAERDEEATRVRIEAARSAEQQQRDATELLRAVEGQVNRLALNRKQMETLSERVVAAEAALLDAEQRIGTMAAADQALAGLSEKVDGLASRITDMIDQAQALEQKQALLSRLEERLVELEGTTKRTDWQFESLTQRRSELTALKAEFEAFDRTYAGAQTLVDRLLEDKTALMQFAERSSSFVETAKTIETRIGHVTASIAQAEANAVKVLGMSQTVDDLASQIADLTPRLQLVEDLAARLNDLNGLSADVDHKLTAQLARQADLDGVRVSCEGLTLQLADAQQKLAALGSAQTRLAPLTDLIARLEDELSATRGRVDALHRDEESVAAQEGRLETLNASARALALDVAQRMETMQSLHAELTRVAALKEHLSGDLAQMLSMQCEAFAKGREAEDQLRQLADRCNQIHDQQSHLDVVEGMMAAFEGRLRAIAQLSERVDARMNTIAARERIVEAVRHEIETIHDVARKSHEDLTAIAGQREQIAQGTADVTRLMEALAGTSAAIEDVDRRGRIVDDVRRKADAVAHLLDDVRVTLDAVGVQKAMIDHVADKVAHLDDVLAEARATTKALQAERSMAQRIVDNLRNVHARTGAEIRQLD
jgi:chromosome segregation ATPase